MRIQAIAFLFISALAAFYLFSAGTPAAGGLGVTRAASGAVVSGTPVWAFPERPRKTANPEKPGAQGDLQPQNGYVPDEQTAVSIAVAVWTPIYGKDQIESERPYRAALKNDVWTVSGTQPKGRRKGGVARIEITKMDARILRVIHGE